MKPIHSIALLSVVLLASCASDKDKTAAAPAPAHKSMNERFGGGGARDPDSFRQDANGKLVINNAKRSPFESKGDSYYAGKSYQKQEYKTGDFSKKSWWGNKQYDRQTYTGNTDGSRFEKSSALDGKAARDTGSYNTGTYNTGNYATGDSRESTSTRIREAGTAARENSKTNDQFQWDERRPLSINESKSLLGK